MSLGSTLDPKVGLKTGDQEVGDFHAPALGQAIATPTHSRSTGLSSGDVVAELNEVCDDLVQVLSSFRLFKLSRRSCRRCAGTHP